MTDFIIYIFSRRPEVTSAVRRRSSVGIQRQASVCLSDEDEQELSVLVQKFANLSKAEVTEVSAIVHNSDNERPVAHNWDQKPTGSIKPIVTQTVTSTSHPPFIHSHSSPDSRSTAAAADAKQNRLPSTFSLQGICADSLARVVDLEDYHYSRQQLWELASQGATLLKERSQSSLDIVVCAERWVSDPKNIQEAESTETGLLERALEQHQLENFRTLLQRYSPVDEEDEKIWSKVRYNDTGSREDIRDDVIEIISGESDESSYSGESEVKEQYRKLWELRATLEEEADLSDMQESEDELCDAPLAQPEEDDEIDDPDPKPCSSRVVSFEATPTIAGGDCDEGTCDYLQLPLHEMRRHCYKSLLTKRLQRRIPSDHRVSCGGESSFESVESSSTDRTEGATTSFESTTDNTDSANESQTTRLQQMKADSGYKSIESNGKAPRLSKKQLQFAVDGDSLDTTLTIDRSFEGASFSFDASQSMEKDAKIKSTAVTAKKTVRGGISTDIPVILETATEKKRSKSALKKHYTEGDIHWNEQQTLPDLATETKGKTSVFHRFFRYSRQRADPAHVYRDYSIDEKSDALFREFSRSDLYESEVSRTRARLHGHMRLHHRSLPPVDSPHGGRKVLSSHQSIEEEGCESGEDHHDSGEKNLQYTDETVRSGIEEQAHIPVIFLSQDRGEKPQ